MNSAYERKKQPDLVRKKLLACATRLSTERGLAGLTLQAVADAAGVTKGGLLHHFRNKQDLQDAVFDGLLRRMDEEIDKAMAEDPLAYGRFTRAYVRVSLHPESAGSHTAWAALSISILTDPTLRRTWSDWSDARLRRHRETDAAPALQVVRYAADGVWLTDLMAMDKPRPKERQVLLARLVAMTREQEE